MSVPFAKIPRPMQVPAEQTEPIGLRLKRLRLERGLSQRELSSPGVSYAYISRIEAGARTPSVKALRTLAQKLSVSVEYLETGREIGAAEQRELKLSDAELELRLADDTRGAEAKLQEVLADAERAGDRLAAARALYSLGFAAARRGTHLDAVERLEKALQQHHVAPHLRPDVYATLGQSYAALGAPDRAVRLFEQCLEDVREAAPEDVTVHVRFATLLSYALGDAGDTVRAAEVVQAALQGAEDRVGAYDRVRLYWALARAANIDGRHLEALDYIRRAIALLEATDDTLHLARGYLLAAGIEARQRQTDALREHLECAERLLGARPEPSDLGILRIGQSWLAALEGDAQRAVERAREALDRFGTEYGAEQGTAVWALASALASARDLTGADDAFRRAVDLLVVHGRRHDAARAATEWAEALTQAGREDEAARARERAAAVGLNLVNETRGG